MALEGGNFISKKYKGILPNLSVPVEEIKNRLATCDHNNLPVHEREINQIVGILPIKPLA
jgi:Mg2+/Co2+ transporter CorB